MTFDKAYVDAGISRIGTNCVKWTTCWRKARIRI